MNSQLLKISLLITRITVVWMMGIWAWMRIAENEKALYVAQTFYSSLTGSVDGTMQMVLGAIMLLIYLLALIGFKKKFTYLFLFFVHLLGTLLVLKYSLPFFEDFKASWFTSWPALMAMWLLWVLRDEDTLLTVPAKWG